MLGVLHLHICEEVLWSPRVAAPDLGDRVELVLQLPLIQCQATALHSEEPHANVLQLHSRRTCCTANCRVAACTAACRSFGLGLCRSGHQVLRLYPHTAVDAVNLAFPTSAPLLEAEQLRRSAVQFLRSRHAGDCRFHALRKLSHRRAPGSSGAATAATELLRRRLRRLFRLFLGQATGPLQPLRDHGSRCQASCRCGASSESCCSALVHGSVRRRSCSWPFKAEQLVQKSSISRNLGIIVEVSGGLQHQESASLACGEAVLGQDLVLHRGKKPSMGLGVLLVGLAL
mmetsp:Transcript_97205/g.208497  ORF Transcript_97205/g.208497 Transcript_97205/m.208497 type:complete len:287 (+) Transcript_97205:71-931(+)